MRLAVATDGRKVAVHLAAKVFDLGFGEDAHGPSVPVPAMGAFALDTRAGRGHSSKETASAPGGPSKSLRDVPYRDHTDASFPHLLLMTGLSRTSPGLFDPGRLPMVEQGSSRYASQVARCPGRTCRNPLDGVARPGCHQPAGGRLADERAGLLPDDGG